MGTCWRCGGYAIHVCKEGPTCKECVLESAQINKTKRIEDFIDYMTKQMGDK